MEIKPYLWKPKHKFSKAHLQNIAASSFYVTLILIFSFIPYTGYWRILLINFTTLPILVVVANYHIEKFGAISVATAIGVGSWLRALVFGDPTQLFIFPDVAILPRFLSGYFLYLLTHRWIHKKPVLVFFLSALLAVFLNTSLVTAAIFLHHQIIPNQFLSDKTLLVWISIIWVNFVVEIIVALFLASASLRLALHLQKKYLALQKISWS